ncbi:MAG TPA: alpha/beta fold hydrolase [Agriterribacter sp.]|nr:alpha/beta fold hydrolase [Agriterribacter sp.]
MSTKIYAISRNPIVSFLKIANFSVRSRKIHKFVSPAARKCPERCITIETEEMTEFSLIKFIYTVCLFLFTGGLPIYAISQNDAATFEKTSLHQPPRAFSDTLNRKALLEEIVRFLPPDYTKNGTVSYQDSTFQDWLTRTGELPPDFDKMPSIPSLPNPLIIDEGGKNIPVKTKQQWERKKGWMRKALQHYITGTFPPPPDNLQTKVLSEKKDGRVILRIVELRFGTEHQAKLTIELMIPPGKGPFPVFLSQWNHRGWAQVAVRRGYIGCVYAGADDKDDTEDYSRIWAQHYDFTRIMRRAFAASRAIDYLYTLPLVDKEKIGLTGHSRNGKLSLWAAAFDERIKAVIPSSGGSGGEVPWRYTSHKYDVEDIALLSCAQPAWLHPRLRFFIGREDKLPVDQNSFMALIAPRGLMLSAAVNETAANSLGIEQAYETTKKLYQFLGAENNIAIRFREGQHGTNANDIEAYVDFFDYIFKRSARKPENKLVSSFSFEKWRLLSGENINPLNYPLHSKPSAINGKAEKEMLSLEQWELKKLNIQKQIQWALGTQPPGATNPGPFHFIDEDSGEKYFGTSVQRPESTSVMGRVALAPYNEFGDYLYGYLYYPKAREAEIKAGTIKLPAVIYLHEFDYSKGFSSENYDHEIAPFFQHLVSAGYVVFAYDMIGFGTRLEEGKQFYQRYPHWSKMGKMITDVQSAVTTLANLNFIDSTEITVAGYSLGATAGVFTAALDKRIAKVVSVCGFIPLRTPGAMSNAGLFPWTHVYGLLPRLGFFIGYENRLPFDFDDLLSSIAPRPLLLITPLRDKEVSVSLMERFSEKAGEVYRLYNRMNKIQVYSPSDYNRFSIEMQKKTIEWLKNKE